MFEKLIHKTLRVPYKLKVQVDNGSGETVILLHGLVSNYHIWDSVIPNIENHCRSISFDLLGFGDSPKPTWLDYSIDYHIAALHRSIKALNIKKPIVLVGHSMGSIIAVAYAHKYPKGVASLVLCSLPIYSPEAETGPLGVSLDKLYARIYQRIIDNKKLSLREAAIIKKIMRYNDEFDPNDMTWHGTAQSLQNTILSQTSLDLASQIKQRIDVISGKADMLVIKKNLESFVSEAPNAKLHYINATHTINSTYASKIAETIQKQVSAL